MDEKNIAWGKKFRYHASRSARYNLKTETLAYIRTNCLERLVPLKREYEQKQKNLGLSYQYNSTQASSGV